MPNVIYSVTPDYVYLRRNNIHLKIGDIIKVVDTDLGVTFNTRILVLKMIV